MRTIRKIHNALCLLAVLAFAGGTVLYFAGSPAASGFAGGLQSRTVFAQNGNADLDPDPGGGDQDPDPGGGGGGKQIKNPIKYNSIGELIVAVMNFLLVMVGALSVLFIIIGAVRMTTSGGNESAVKAGKTTVTWAVIGLVTALMAFSLIAMLQNVLGRT